MLLLIPVPIIQVDGVNMTFLTTRAYLKKKQAVYYERVSFAKYTYSPHVIQHKHLFKKN